jgi:hypothetical protein
MKDILKALPGEAAALWRRYAGVIYTTDRDDKVSIGDVIVTSLLRLANNGQDVDPPTEGANLELQWVNYLFSGSGTLTDLNLGDGFLIHATGFSGGPGPVTIAGLTSSSGGEQAYLFVNDSGQPVTFQHNGGSVGKKVFCPNAVDLILDAGGPGSNTVLLYRLKSPSGPTATLWIACPLNFWPITPGAGAPTDAQYLVGAFHSGLSAERLVTDTSTVTWDLSTASQAKANTTWGRTFLTMGA